MLVYDQRSRTLVLLLYTHTLRHTHAFNTDLLFNVTFSPDTGEKKVRFNATMLHTFIKKGTDFFRFNLLTLKAQKDNDPT